MPISHICIIWTVSYKLLPSISNFTFVVVDFLLTSDYLSYVFVDCFIGKLPLTVKVLHFLD